MMEEEYISVSNAAKEIGVERATLYHYLKALHIKPQRFPLSRQSFITPTEVQRIKDVRARPWIARVGRIKEKEESIA